jgi:hypothetical protein
LSGDLFSTRWVRSEPDVLLWASRDADAIGVAASDSAAIVPATAIVRDLSMVILPFGVVALPWRVRRDG